MLDRLAEVMFVMVLRHHIQRAPELRGFFAALRDERISRTLAMPVYDTQCGAKLFSRTPALAASLERPFRSRWVFDVELLARLLAPGDGVPAIHAAEMQEFPLRTWRDVAGSKLRLGAMLRASVGLNNLKVLMRGKMAGQPQHVAEDYRTTSLSLNCHGVAS